jgi:transcriptional regulator with XRE-family HTH domain
MADNEAAIDQEGWLTSQLYWMRSQSLLNCHQIRTNNHHMNNKCFGEILEILMADKRISISTLAKDLKVPSRTVQEWIGKAGRVPRNLESIKKLAEYFDVSVHYLLFGEEDPRSLIDNILEKTAIHTGMYEITIKKVKPKDRK